MLRVAWLGLRRARDRLGLARLAILVRLCISQVNPENDVNTAGEGSGCVAWSGSGVLSAVSEVYGFDQKTLESSSGQL